IGFWAVLHEIRSEFAQLLNCAFLLLVGPGAWSIDALLARRIPWRQYGTLSSLPQEHSMQ
ncbi:MAG TPA: hypothetical protein VFP64_07185, partial [Pyrinomonadaceae bacterium]|nr:hypothetical protein [Pyrinomonadaceae bacterium]